MDSPHIVSIPVRKDDRGTLAVIEHPLLPFDVKRVYYLFDVQIGAIRGSHAHKSLRQVIIAMAGSFQVRLNDGSESDLVFGLNNPSQALMIPPGHWRTLEEFSSGAVALVLASELFDDDDYIRDYEEFVQWKKNQ